MVFHLRHHLHLLQSHSTATLPLLLIVDVAFDFRGVVDVGGWGPFVVQLFSSLFIS